MKKQCFFIVPTLIGLFGLLIILFVCPSVVAVEYGFNTHISAAGNNLDLATFKNNIDDLVAAHQQWIRFTIMDFEIAPSGSSTAIQWNTDALTIYDQAIDYAVANGLKILLVTNTPISIAQSYSPADYQSVTRLYYQFLAARYKGKIAMWQIFNEADVHNFHDYSLLSQLTPAYLDELHANIAIAKTEITAADNHILITTNVSGYPIDDQNQTRWLEFFDAVQSDLDAITLDIYPSFGGMVTEIAQLNTRLSAVKQRYGKSLVIGETGICTRTTLFTVDDQERILPQIISALKSVTPAALLVYEMQDQNTIPDNWDGSCGIKNYDGSRKTSYQTIMASMADPIIPTPTQPIIPVYPSWWNQIPTTLRNFLEQLYMLVYYFKRPSNMQYLLDGVFPIPTP